MPELPYRQIHLDFHTSPMIEGVGDLFDKDQFIQALKLGHVNSVNIFAKCHHGMCYYPTKTGTIHPHLKGRDLFGEMTEACRENGIGVVAYVPVGWEEDAAERHPEWLQVGQDGVLGGKRLLEDGYYRWRLLCHNNEEYIRYVLAQTEEVLTGYKPDGFWYDIIVQAGCLCSSCRRSMAGLGLNLADELNVKRHDQMVLQRFMDRITTFIQEFNPEAKVYFNREYLADQAETGAYGVKQLIRYNTHIDIESIPSGKWGYNHFPLNANYHNAAGNRYEIVGMTGKFHKAWGDFGTLKNQAALEYECFRMLASGAKCSIGDQLHPDGEMDLAVYLRIGEVYSSVEAKEPWCIGSEKEARIGVFTGARELDNSWSVDGVPKPPGDEGAMRMMLELHQPFDMIGSESDWSQYEVILLPDHIRFDEKLVSKAKAYLQDGGRMLLTHESGLTEDGSRFALSEFGVRYAGSAPFAPDYIRICGDFSEQLKSMDWCFYKQGSRVETEDGSQVLAIERNPYFNRTYDRFSSHCQTPPNEVTEYPSILQNGDGSVIYISKPVFSDYLENGVRAYRDIVGESLLRLQNKPLIRTDLPSTAEVNLRRQGSRTIVHILHYVPQRRSKELEVVEDVLPLYKIGLSVRMDAQPTRAYIAPTLEPLKAEFLDGYATVEVPEIRGHAMIVFE